MAGAPIDRKGGKSNGSRRRKENPNSQLGSRKDWELKRSKDPPRELTPTLRMISPNDISETTKKDWRG